MNKDIVYIDVEDDITAVIGKVKDAKEKIVALVPPKHVGILQSAVNLRLLDRAAKQHDKQIVLITGSKALSSLAAAAKIPVAKNLQSKPELGEIAALDVDDGEDIIDGGELAVGEHADSVAPEKTDAGLVARDKAVGSLAVGDTTSGETPLRTRTAAKTVPKVPNFSRFRKKVFLLGGGALALLVFLIWAIFFASHATVVIKATTSDSGVSQQVSVNPSQPTSADDTRIKSEVKTSSSDVKVEFSATGKKDVGEKATGSVTFSTSSQNSKTIAAGTELTTNGGLVFILNSSVTVPAATLSFGCPGYVCPGAASGAVTASKPGTSYNAATGSLSGTPSGVSASFDDATSGGTDKTVNVVTQSDVDKALASAKDSIDTSAAKSALSSQFGDEYTVLDGSFTADTSGVKSNTAVGAEPSGSPAITGTAKYSLYAVKKSDLEGYLTSALESQFDNPDSQKVYDSGISNATFTNVKVAKNMVSATLTAKGKIGPKIDTDNVKNLAKGQKLGTVQSKLGGIDGVSSVTVDFSPFWVNTVPNDPNRISIKFSVDG